MLQLFSISLLWTPRNYQILTRRARDHAQHLENFREQKSQEHCSSCRPHRSNQDTVRKKPAKTRENSTVGRHGVTGVQTLKNRRKNKTKWHGFYIHITMNCYSKINFLPLNSLKLSLWFMSIRVFYFGVVVIKRLFRNTYVFLNFLSF